MLRSLTYCLIASVALSVACSRPSNSADVPPEVLTLADSLRQAFAPDQRTALFQPEFHQSPDQILITGLTTIPAARQALIENLQAQGYSIQDSLRLLPDTSQLGNQTWGLVNLSVCNIRSRPAHSAELSTQATLGTPLRIYEQQNDWYRVQTPDGYFGWLDAGGFTLLTEAEWIAWKQEKRVIYLPDMGFALENPAANARRVSDLLAGNILVNIQQRDGFTQVQFPDGRLAWIPTQEVLDFSAWLDTRAPTPDNILATAADHLGRPYLWGGTSGKAMDCSGFTKTVFYLNGLLLPRDASQQVHIGRTVPTDTTWRNLQPGDLLFFGRPASDQQPEKITHVAIYQGDGRIIHASQRVREQSLRPGDPDFAPERLKTFIRAKRVLDTQAERYAIPLSDLSAYQIAPPS